MKKEPNLLLLGFGLAYLVIVYFFFMAVIKGGVLNTLKAAALAAPFLLIWLNSLRRFWMGLFLGACWFYVINVPVPLLSAFNVYGILLLAFAGFFLLDLAMKREPLFKRKEALYGVLLAYGVCVLLRVVTDPPGSARLGGTGGLSVALKYIYTAFVFPITYWVCRQVKSWRWTVRFAVVLSVLAWLYSEVYLMLAGVAIDEGTASVYGLTFGRALYFPFALMLVFSASGRPLLKMKRSIPFVVAALFLMAMGVLSQVRSAPIQAVAMVWSVAFLYKRLGKMVVITLVAGIIGLGGLLAVMPFEELPNNIKRTVSIFRGSDSRSTGYGEIGFQSGFRQRLYEYAWEEIKQNPAFGAGWSFKRQAILEAVAITNFREARWAKLAMTGSYHNSLLTMAGKNGVLTALLYLIATVGLLWRFGWWLRKEPDGEVKRLGGLFFCYISTTYLMLFVNGGGYEAMMILVALAVLAYLHDSRRGSSKTREAVECI